MTLLYEVGFIQSLGPARTVGQLFGTLENNTGTLTTTSDVLTSPGAES